METYTKEVATDLVFPNITIYRLLCNGEHYGYEIVADVGYLMYDETAHDFKLDKSGNKIPITYYTPICNIPKNYNFNAFSWIAVEKKQTKEN